MKIQTIEVGDKKRWIMLDDDYLPVITVNAFIKSLDATHSPNTLRSYIFRLLTYFQFLNASGYTEYDVYDPTNKRRAKDIMDEYISFLQDPASTMLAVNGQAPVRHTNDTINQYKDTVIAFYEFLKEEEIIPESVSFKKKSNSNIPRVSSHVAAELFRGGIRVKENYGDLPSKPKLIEFITRDQYIEIFKMLDCERDRLIAALMFEGAMRIGEVRGLWWEDLVDAGRGLIHIVPRDNNPNNARVKNNDGGTIPIPGYVADMILDYESGFPTDLPHNFVFVSEGRNKNNPIGYNAIWKKFNIVSKKIGLNFHPHLFRHGYAAEKIRWGYTESEIQAVLRHRNISTTIDIYAHLKYLFESEEMAKKLRNSKIMYGGILIPQE